VTGDSKLADELADVAAAAVPGTEMITYDVFWSQTFPKWHFDHDGHDCKELVIIHVDASSPQLKSFLGVLQYGRHYVNEEVGEDEE